MFGGLYALAVLIGISLYSGLSTRAVSRKQPTKGQIEQTFQDAQYSFNPDTDARRQIALQLKKSPRIPYSVSLTYKMCDSELVATTQEVHFKQYRKKPQFEKMVYTRDKKPNNSITFTYKPGKSLVKVSTNKKLKTRSVQTFKAENFTKNCII